MHPNAEISGVLIILFAVGAISFFSHAALSDQSAPSIIASLPPVNLRIGMMIPQNASSPTAFENTAGAATLAINRLLNAGLSTNSSAQQWQDKQQILPAGSNITLQWRFEECEPPTSAGNAFQMIHEQGVDMLLAPPCFTSAELAGDAGTFYNLPVYLWGPVFEFGEGSIYPSVMSVAPCYADLATVTCAAMKFFQWDVFAILFGGDVCSEFETDLQNAADGSGGSCTIGFQQMMLKWDPQYVANALNNTQANARIILICFDDPVQTRNMLVALNEAGMNTADYVYLFPNTGMFGNQGMVGTPFWLNETADDGLDSTAYQIVKRGFALSVNTNVVNESLGESYTTFSREVVEAMADWPFYCSDCDHGQNSSVYASYLYDAVYAYGLAVSRLINATGSTSPSVYRNGFNLTKNTGLRFQGMSGMVQIGTDGVREADYLLSSYPFEGNGSLQPYVTIQIIGNTVVGANTSWYDSNSQQSIWASRGGVQPLSTPKCGFNGKGCAVDFFTQYEAYVVIAAVLLVLVAVSFVLGLFYLIRMRLEEAEKLNRLWQIPSGALVKPEKKTKAMESVHSIQSHSTSTTRISNTGSLGSRHQFYGNDVYLFNGERVICKEHPAVPRLDTSDMAELRAMRTLDADNVNRFIGLSMGGGEGAQGVLSVWRYCSRGPLSEVIAGNTQLTMDGFFIYSLVRDVCEGLRFLHASPVGWHGNLRTTNSLIDDRWQVKLSEFGLRAFRVLERRTASELLWSAPEVIRTANYVGSKPADVYSFAVCCSELVNMKPAWENAESGKADPEEVIYLVKKAGGRHPYRPRVEPSTNDISPALLHLIRDCWAEAPEERPRMDVVRSLLSSMNTGRSTNLMDHVFSMLEQYAGSLEQEVEERMKELMEEKKKSDVVLFRMLPRQVAEKLKLGQSVEPESFECVTVFFSDVVSFTTLASRCTPLQVVNLLNDLYTLLDSIIAEFDVYKVETIGDGYMCVSGLPLRNGNEHARHIANMSLAFMRNLVHFQIPHLPGERLRMRIGAHSGACVAGVVGLTMPRFCLFGDTVNIASRMEANSKRGLTLPWLKLGKKMIGIGVMETYWLLGVEGDPNLEWDKEIGDGLDGGAAPTADEDKFI